MKIQNSRTTKEPSPHQKLRMLKTKAWAWSCAYSLSESAAPLKGYSLSKAADRFLVQNNRAATNDPKAWDYRLKGKQSASESTVDSLWENLQNVYKIGPWAGETITPNSNTKSKFMFGGYVPLWSVLTGDETQIIDSWNNISSLEWEAWLLDFCDHQNKDLLNLLPPTFTSSIELYKFIINLTKRKNVPPLLSLTASITIARLMKHTKTQVYRKSKEDTHALDITMRNQIDYLLDCLNLTIEEIVDVAESYNLTISGFSDSYVKESKYPDWYIKALNEKRAARNNQPQTQQS